MAEEKDCPECETMRARLRTVLEERDAALLAVARERERLNALLVAQPAPRHWTTRLAARFWRGERR